jgi:type IV pilus assembly protein PilE
MQQQIASEENLHCASRNRSSKRAWVDSFFEPSHFIDDFLQMNAMQLPITSRTSSGFTLIELMVTLVIAGVLAAIAIPMYKDYIVSGDIVEATNTLSALRAQMEQYYQDNRTYQDVSGSKPAINSPCGDAMLSSLNNGLKYFTVTCPTLTATTYTLVATGISSKPTSGFIYNLDNYNTQSSTMGAAWGGANCTSSWKTSHSGGC